MRNDRHFEPEFIQQANSTPDSYIHFVLTFLGFRAQVFTLPASGFFGNAGRKIVTGPGSLDRDFPIFKHFRLSENKSLQFRTEAFNILNRVNFGIPLTNLFTSGGARPENTGVITQTLIHSREIQFGLKLNF